MCLCKWLSSSVSGMLVSFVFVFYNVVLSVEIVVVVILLWLMLCIVCYSVLMVVGMFVIGWLCSMLVSSDVMSGMVFVFVYV